MGESKFLNFFKSIFDTSKSIVITPDNIEMGEETIDSQIKQVDDFEEISNEDKEILKKSLIDINKIVNDSENYIKGKQNQNTFVKNVKVKSVKQESEISKKIEEIKIEKDIGEK